MQRWRVEEIPSTRVLGAGVGLEALQLDFRNHEAYAGSSSLTRTVVHHLNPLNSVVINLTAAAR